MQTEQQLTQDFSKFQIKRKRKQLWKPQEIKPQVRMMEIRPSTQWEYDSKTSETQKITLFGSTTAISVSYQTEMYKAPWLNNQN